MFLLVEYLQEFRRFQRNARLYLISNALGGVTTGIITVLYNLYLVSLGYHADFIGLILLVATLGGGLAIFPAGFCVDRMSGKQILIWSSLLIGVAGAGQVVFHQQSLLLVSAFVLGVGGAFVLVVNAPFLTTNSTTIERPLLFSLNIVLSLATVVLGEVLGGFLPLWFRTFSWFMTAQPLWLANIMASTSEARSYQLALLAAGVIALPSFIPLFLMSDEASGTVPEKKASEGAHVERTYQQSKVETDALPLREGLLRGKLFSFWTALAASLSGYRESFRQSIGAARVNLTSAQLRKIFASDLFLLTLIQTLVGMGAGLFIPYFNIYFVQHLGASSALFGAIDGSANALNAILTLLAPWLALRVGKINSIIVTRLLSIPLLLLIGLTNYLPLAAVLYPFRQGLMDMSNGIWQVFSMEAVQQEHRGLANSSYQAAFQVASAITAPIGGLIIVHIGYIPLFLCAAALYMLALVLLWRHFRLHK